MNISNKEYDVMVKKATPNSKLFTDCVKAFIVGGIICVIGQIIMEGYLALDIKKDDASALTSATLVLVGALLTAFGVYDKIANLGKAGTLVPITGFANSIVSPAMEYKTEGLVPGVGSKMFIIAGPVLVYGITASVIYAVIYKLLTGM
ncbi:MAG: stage V sporulation protein AC [Clostridia bacterium]|nr:stage V sporulation protein AC [Clostridia bacterium]